MFCRNCGKEMKNGANFCSVCGTPVSRLAAENAAKTGAVPGGNHSSNYVTQNIMLCGDGVYRWYYELNMLKNPIILFTVWKVLGISIGITYLIIVLIQVFSGDFDSLLTFTGIFCAILAGLLVLGAIAYLITAAILGGKYCVLFEMDENRVSHIQVPMQFKKAEAIAWLSVFAGVVSGKPGLVGQGLLIATKSSTTSEFKNVQSVKIRRSLNLIHVNQTLNKNQVYADDADFDFVRNFIVQHCTSAKIK